MSKDVMQDIITRVSAGNPGAVNAIISMGNSACFENPTGHGHDGIEAIRTLDRLGIRGSEVWILYKDLCKQNSRTFLIIMTAVKLCFLPECELIAISKCQDRSVTLSDERIQELDDLVCKERGL